MGIVPAEANSFLTACEVLRDLLALKACVTEERAEALAANLQRYGAAKIASYGRESCKPKSHYNLHIAPQCMEDGVMLDMFLLERHHRRIKGIAQHHLNLPFFNRSVLAAATMAHVNSLAEDGELFAGILGEAQELPGHGGVRIGRQMISENGLHFSVGDFCFFGPSHGAQAGLVEACITNGVAHGVQVLLYHPLERLRCSGTYAEDHQGRSEHWEARLLTRAIAWRYNEDGTVIIMR